MKSISFFYYILETNLEGMKVDICLLLLFFLAMLYEIRVLYFRNIPYWLLIMLQIRWKKVCVVFGMKQITSKQVSPLSQRFKDIIILLFWINKMFAFSKMTTLCLH